MTEQQQFRPGDRVKVTAELTVVEVDDPFPYFNEGTAYAATVGRWANELDHITVELIERPEPALEPGWYVCRYSDTTLAMRWDGEMWRWPKPFGRVVLKQDNVTVLGTVTLDEGVEL